MVTSMRILPGRLSSTSMGPWAPGPKETFPVMRWAWMALRRATPPRASRIFATSRSPVSGPGCEKDRLMPQSRSMVTSVIAEVRLNIEAKIIVQKELLHRKQGMMNGQLRAARLTAGNGSSQSDCGHESAVGLDVAIGHARGVEREGRSS